MDNGTPAPHKKLGQTPSTKRTFQKKFRKKSGKTPETLSKRFLALPSRVRLGSPKPHKSRHLKVLEHFKNSLPLSTAGDASVSRWFRRTIRSVSGPFGSVSLRFRSGSGPFGVRFGVLGGVGERGFCEGKEYHQARVEATKEAAKPPDNFHRVIPPVIQSHRVRKQVQGKGKRNLKTIRSQFFSGSVILCGAWYRSLADNQGTLWWDL